MIHCVFVRALFAVGLLQTGLPSAVHTLQTVEEAVGEDALLSCQMLQSKEVVHVTWQKESLDGETNLATYHRSFGSNVIPPFRGKVEVKGGELHNSSIVIKNVTEEDESCYLCLFITKSDGELPCRTCLRVYELHGPDLQVRESNSSEEFLVSCSATGRPAPSIALGVPQLLPSQQNTVSVTNTDGTVTVTATAMLAGFTVSGRRARCGVQVLSAQKEAFVEIPLMKVALPSGLKEGSGSALSHFMLVAVVTCLCAALVFTAFKLLIRKQRSSPSLRDLEKTEVRQTEDADTVPEPLSPTEKSQLRNRTPPTEREPKKNPEMFSKARRLQFGLVGGHEVSTESQKL